jgi:hypothetical protein
MPEEPQPQRSTEHIPTWEEKEKVWIHLSRWEEQQEIWNHKAKNTKRIIILLNEITEILSHDDVKIHELNFKIERILKQKAHLHIKDSESKLNLLEEAIIHKNKKVIKLIIGELIEELKTEQLEISPKKNGVIKILRESLELHLNPYPIDISNIIYKSLEMLEDSTWLAIHNKYFDDIP